MSMIVAFAVITTVAIMANIVAAMADFTRSNFALANSIRIGVPLSWLPTLGMLKFAGAGGLLLGYSASRISALRPQSD